ncbi:MAG: hypothetical protein HY600_05580 [Candidatus Omnitrophica bacterium]|nr:hypothetical protein [Candidatus Omnitrophota bacterium]
MTPPACERQEVIFNHVFRDSLEAAEGTFVAGRHLDGWCRRLERSRKTSTKSARKHAKSTTLYALILWLIFRLQHQPGTPRYQELLYLSYKDDLSRYHLKKVKRYLEANPWFASLRPVTDAESILHYRTPGGREIVVEPEGILSFKRGRHPDGVLADDILRDPTVQLDLTQIAKITRIFMEEVVSMPKEGGFLHVVGTPQDATDLFSQLEAMQAFDCAQYPALVNEAAQEVLWPEMFPFERLIEIRDTEIGKRAFEKEYQCRPVREAASYFEQSELDAVIDPALPAWTGEAGPPGADYVAGLDVGKRSHPSHLAVFRKEGASLIQVLSRWFDRTDYTEQVEFLKAVHARLGLMQLRYDNTRGELEGFAEQGLLPPRSEGVAFTAKTKFELAAMLAQRVRERTIRLLDDPRQKRQLLAVDAGLQAPETPDGHGDSFFSLCLSVLAAGGTPLVVEAQEEPSSYDTEAGRIYRPERSSVYAPERRLTRWHGNAAAAL